MACALKVKCDSESLFHQNNRTEYFPHRLTIRRGRLNTPNKDTIFEGVAHM